MLPRVRDHTHKAHGNQDAERKGLRLLHGRLEPWCVRCMVGFIPAVGVDQDVDVGHAHELAMADALMLATARKDFIIAVRDNVLGCIIAI